MLGFYGLGLYTGRLWGFGFRGSEDGHTVDGGYLAPFGINDRILRNSEDSRHVTRHVRW